MKSIFFKQTKASLFMKDWDWTGEVLKALGQMRSDFYRLPAYGIMMNSMSKFALPMLKGEKDIPAGMKEWAAYVSDENKKTLEAIK